MHCQGAFPAMNVKWF